MSENIPVGQEKEDKEQDKEAKTMYDTASEQSLCGAFFLIGYPCQWIFASVFGVVSAYSFSVSHADV